MRREAIIFLTSNDNRTRSLRYNSRSPVTGGGVYVGTYECKGREYDSLGLGSAGSAIGDSRTTGV